MAAVRFHQYDDGTHIPYLTTAAGPVKLTFDIISGSIVRYTQVQQSQSKSQSQLQNFDERMTIRITFESPYQKAFSNWENVLSAICRDWHNNDTPITETMATRSIRNGNTVFSATLELSMSDEELHHLVRYNMDDAFDFHVAVDSIANGTVRYSIFNVTSCELNGGINAANDDADDDTDPRTTEAFYTFEPGEDDLLDMIAYCASCYARMVSRSQSYLDLLESGWEYDPELDETSCQRKANIVRLRLASIAELQARCEEMIASHNKGIAIDRNEILRMHAECVAFGEK